MSIQGISLHVERPTLSSDPVNQINTFRQYLNVLGDSQAKDENKLKAAQELNDSFDVIIAHPQYQTFLDHAMRVFLKLLQVKHYLFNKNTFSINTLKSQGIVAITKICKL